MQRVDYIRYKKRGKGGEEDKYPLKIIANAFLKFALDVTLFLYFAEPNAGELKVIRLDLQQQVVYRHLDYPLPEQEGSVRGENPQVSSHDLFRRIRR